MVKDINTIYSEQIRYLEKNLGIYNQSIDQVNKNINDLSRQLARISNPSIRLKIERGLEDQRSRQFKMIHERQAVIKKLKLLRMGMSDLGIG